MNRKPRQSRFKKDDIINAINGSMGIVQVVAQRLGVCREQVWKYRQKWKDVDDAIVNELNRGIDFAESQLMSLIKDKDFRAISFYLERKGRDRGWGVQQEVSVTQAVSVRPIIRFGEEPRREDGADV